MTQEQLDRLSFDTYVNCNLSYAAAAYQLGVSASTVRGRVRRYTRRLTDQRLAQRTTDHDAALDAHDAERRRSG